MIEILENEKISKHYESLGLGIPTYISRFDTISGNDKYLVIVDGKKTILSIYHNRSFDKVNRVYNFLEGLRGTEVRTAFPLAKPSELDGHPTLVIEYVEGVETAPHINSYIQVTEVLARIHEFSRMFLPNASVRHDPRVFLKSLPNKIEDSSLISSEEFDEIINLLYRLSNLRTSLDDYMAKGLIHADPIIGNTITSNEGELFLIDFDNLRQDVLALDLGYLIENCLLNKFRIR